MKKILVFIGTLFIFTGVSAQRNFTEIDKWLVQHTDEMGGRLILMIYKDGKVVYTKNVNKMTPRQIIVTKYLTKEQGQTADFGDFTPQTRLPIASCSKWLSAALVMTFVDEGKLNLNDTVGKFLPVLAKNGKGGITISQCLSHLTGIKSVGLKEDLNEMKSMGSMDDAMARIAALPMEGKPGTVFRYSNTGLQIAAAVIEKISGKDFETLFAERIARPLEMKNTDYGYVKVPLPAGGARSTPHDYMNFLTMILNKGTFQGKQVLSQKSVELMQINRITDGVKVAYSPSEAGALGYGFGEWVMSDGSVSSPGMFGSFPMVDNKNGYSAFLMALYLKPDGRGERYVELKALIDTTLQ